MTNSETPHLVLRDNKPIVLAWIPLIVCVINGLLELPKQLGKDWSIVGETTLFWVFLGSLAYWLVALVENFKFKAFGYLIAALATLVGIPVIIDLFTGGNVLDWIFTTFGLAAPEMNASAYFMIALLFFFPQLVWNWIWSRMQTHVTFYSDQMKVTKVGQGSETIELIGLKTHDEPIDYLERVPLGAGAFRLATRTGKTIFEMRRIIGLYSPWWWPFKPGKLARLEALIAGTNVRSQSTTKADIIEAMDEAADDESTEEHHDEGLFEDGGSNAAEDDEIK